MESFTRHSLNQNITIDKISECIEHFVDRCNSALSYIIAKTSQLKNNIAFAISPRANSIVKIEHLHKSCNKLNPYNRKIFILYIKGYSFDEISSRSGAKRHTITTTVSSILKNIPRQNSIS